MALGASRGPPDPPGPGSKNLQTHTFCRARLSGRVAFAVAAYSLAVVAAIGRPPVFEVNNFIGLGDIDALKSSYVCVKS